ncbi:MAG: DUF4358 domain-containing protein [Oscillospiraceae bacterium]
MKKIIALALALTLCLSLFAGCSKKDDSSSPDQGSSTPNTVSGSEEASDYDVAKMLATIEEAAPVRMSTVVDDEYMTFVGLDKTLYKSYAGSYCPVTPGVDVILIVEAQEGKVSEVETILTQKRDDIFKANENYVGALKDKAGAGRIKTKGNIVVLVIGGDETVVTDQGVEKAYEPIDKAIDEAFK